MIIDAHAHVFPPLAGACGFPSVEDHLRFVHLYIGTHGEPVRRLRDHVIVPEAEAALHDNALQGPEGLGSAANFRIGRFGRFEWEWRGETYYRPYLPPSMQEMISPAGFIVQQMGRAGVDRAILQNARPYGRLNDEFAAAVQQFPDRLIGLADVKEDEAHTERERRELRRAIEDLGLRGLYYANRGLFLDRYAYGLDDPKYGPFWEDVAALGIPVFWEIIGTPMPTDETYLRELDRLNNWCARYPGIPCLLTHGIAPEHLAGNLPEPVGQLLEREQMMVEVLYPIHWGRTHDYPYPELGPTVRRLFDLVGAKRLVWGSDMPNVERNCTYRQSREYLIGLLDGIATAAEQESIFGLNALRLVGGA